MIGNNDFNKDVIGNNNFNNKNSNCKLTLNTNPKTIF
jgi:hypothetical protein